MLPEGLTEIKLNRISDDDGDSSRLKRTGRSLTVLNGI
jgi:hypothetical protein